jgi:hypothetical protein
MKRAGTIRSSTGSIAAASIKADSIPMAGSNVHPATRLDLLGISIASCAAVTAGFPSKRGGALATFRALQHFRAPIS